MMLRPSDAVIEKLSAVKESGPEHRDCWIAGPSVTVISDMLRDKQGVSDDMLTGLDSSGTLGSSIGHDVGVGGSE